MTPNENAAETLQLIRDHRNHFDMGNWSRVLPEVWEHTDATPPGWIVPGETPVCGTTLCAAGWSAIAGGYRVALRGNAEGVGTSYAVRQSDWERTSGNVGDTPEAHVEIIGARLLGLSRDAASELFYSADGEAEDVLEALSQLSPDSTRADRNNVVMRILDESYATV